VARDRKEQSRDLALATRDVTGQRFLSRLRRRRCFGGLDLASVSDLTGFVLAWPVRNFVYLYPWSWIPEEGVAERSRRDNVQYDHWLSQGHMEATPGNVTDWRYVTERIKQLKSIFRIQQIGFDRYGARDTVAELIDAGLEVADVGQGYLGMSAGAKRLEELVLSRHLVHTGHPVLRWCIDCTAIAQDPAGNIKPEKPDTRKSSKRIDLTVATVMAIDCLMKAEKKKRSVYSTRGVRTL
jgi:phage terminase large subunit-like protein